MKKKDPTKRPNAADLTRRNLHASNKRLLLVHARIDELEERVIQLEAALNSVDPPERVAATAPLVDT